jgi:hypothetical protein
LRAQAATKRGAHKSCLGRLTNAGKVQAVSIPTSPDRRVVAELSICVVSAGIPQQFKMVITQIEQDTSQTSKLIGMISA